MADRDAPRRDPEPDPDGGAGAPRDTEPDDPGGHGASGQARAGLQAVEPHWVNLPNLVTFLRVLLVPVILWLIASDSDGDTARWWAFGIFVFAAATDSVDGWLARRWHGVTRWGQLADPIADKLLIIGSLASLALVGDLPWWAVNLIVARELAVTLLRIRLVNRLGLVLPASNWGKAKTVSQVVAVAAYLLPGSGTTLPPWLLGLAVLLTIWSGVEYGFRVGRLARVRDAQADVP